MNPSLPPHVQYQQQNQHPQHPQQHSQLSQHQHGQHQQPQSHGHLMPGQDYQGIYDDNAQLRTFQQLQQQQQQQVQQLQQQQQQTQQQLQQLQAAAAAGAAQRMQFKPEDSSSLGYGGNGGAGNVAMNMGGGNMGGGNMGGGNMGGGNMGGSNMGGSNMTGSNMTGSNMTGSNMTGSNMTGSNMTGATMAGGSLSPGMSEANNLHSKYLENEIIKTFPNKSELVKYVKNVLNDEEQCRIVINSSKPKAIYFQCERSGQFRTTVKDSSRRQRVAYTKRSKCAYRLVANLYPPDKDRRRLKNEPGREQLDKLHSFDSNDDSNQEMWILRMINPNHNHPPEPPVVTKKKRSKSARMLVEKPLPRSAHAAAHAAAAAATAGGPGMGPGAGPGPGGASAGYPGAADVMNSHHYSSHSHHNPGTTQSSQGNNHSGHQQDLHDPDVLAAITNPAAAALVNQPPVDPAIDPNVDPSVQEQDHIR